jgi:exopolysaccharide biosynthesis polyprenyl glycosylphosphotransferase
VSSVDIASERPAARHVVDPVGKMGRAATSLIDAPHTREVPRAWEQRYVWLLLWADVTMAGLACLVAFVSRFGTNAHGFLVRYAILSALLPLIWIVALAVCRTYETRLLFVGPEEYQRIIRAGVGLTAGVALVSYWLDARLPRGYLIVVVVLTTPLTVLTRVTLRKGVHRARRRGACMRRVLVLGHPNAVDHVTRQLRRQYHHGLEVVGVCLPADQLPRAPTAPTALSTSVAPKAPEVVGSFDETAYAVDAVRADTVIVLSCPELDGAALRRLAWTLERNDVDLIVASALLDVAGNRITMRPVDGLPMLQVEHPKLGGARRVVKGAFDTLVALLLIVLGAPLLGLIALLVRLDSPGPALFRQMRVGRDGKHFPIVKFRTMFMDAEAGLAELQKDNEHDGVLFKMRDDPRVTRIGRWLRRFSLDELPQLLNIVRGEMSLVGPRPPLPSEVAQYPDDLRRRLVVKPGLTGLWQISGRADLSWDDAVRLDLRYVENWSLTLDLVILLRTAAAVLRRSGAY